MVVVDEAIHIELFVEIWGCHTTGFGLGLLGYIGGGSVSRWYINEREFERGVHGKKTGRVENMKRKEVGKQRTVQGGGIDI